MSRNFLACGDAYLALAMAGGFDWVADMDVSQADQQIALIVRKKKDLPDDMPSIAHRLGCFTSSLYAEESIATFLTTTANLTSNWPKVVAAFDAMELASPLASDAGDIKLQSHDEPNCSFNGPCVVGCIDDGFPVLHPLYRKPSDSDYRLLRYWDQNAHALLKEPWTSVGFRLGYGRQLVNPKGWKQVASGLESASTLSNGVAAVCSQPAFPPKPCDTDDVAYHDALGMKALRHPSTHGAHVLDALAGPVKVVDRVSPDRFGVATRPGHDGRRPVRNKPLDDASSVPLVLVQVPQHALDDASGRWLAAHVLDGIHYILAAADQAKLVVINISWGPQTGPHDGSSLLEQAMDELIAKKKKDCGQQLDIVLPAGNSALSSAYAQLGMGQSEQDSVWWVVPPGQRGPSFLEIWWPKDHIGALEFSLTPPGGSEVTVRAPGVQRFAAWDVVLLRHHSGRYMALVAVSATGSHARVGAHGRWLLSVGNTNDSHVDVYVARTTANMGGRKRGPQSYLMSTGDDGSHKLAALPVQKNPLTPIVKGGALNGIATGKFTTVVGGTRIHDGQPVEYGSQLPFAKPMKPAQETRLLSGLLSGAVRAGAVARLNGTSIAAPQHARDLVNQRTPPNLSTAP